MTKYFKFIGTKFADTLGLSDTTLNEKIKGKAGDDTLYGGLGNDKIKGANGDDWIVGDVGNDDIDGGKGIDVAVYQGRFDDYQLSFKSNLNGTIKDLVGGRDGTDTLKNVEFLKFANGIYDIANDTFQFFNLAPTLATPSGITYNDTANHDAFASAPATLSATDPNGDTLTYSIGGGTADNSLPGYHVSKASAYGTLYLNSASGAYVFVPASGAIEALKTSVSVAFTVAVSDGEFSDSKTLAVAFNGVDDTATIGGTTSAAVTEDDTLTAGGTLTIKDSDTGDAHFQWPVSLTGTYGSFTFNAATGAWGYTLANGSDAVQHLGGDATVHDTLTVMSLDNSASRTIDVTIHGANDAPVLQAPIPTGQVFAGDRYLGTASLTLTATMAFADIDLTDVHSVTFTALGSGYVGDFTPVVGTDSTNSGNGSVGLTYHLTQAQVEAGGGLVPDHQDYLVTIDDLHGGTNSQTVSIPLAQIIGGGGGGGPTQQPPVFLNTSPPNPFTIGQNLGQIVDNPFVLHPSYIPPEGFSTDLFTQGTLYFSDPDGGNHHASVDLAHAQIVGHFIVDADGVPQPVPGAPVVGTFSGTWQVYAQEPGQVSWNYTLSEFAVRSMSQGEWQTMIFPVTVYEDGVGQSTQNVRIDLFGTDEPTSVLAPNTVLAADTDITPYLLPIDVATHVQTQDLWITEDPFVTGSTIHHTLSGTIAYVDADLLDRPTVTLSVYDGSHTEPGEEAFNALIQTLQNGFSFTVEQFGNYGNIHWTYDVVDSALDFLAQGSTYGISATFNIGATPGGPGGGGSSSTLNVNFLGSNDIPVIQGPTTSHATYNVGAHGSTYGSFILSDPDWYPDGQSVEFLPRNPDYQLDPNGLWVSQAGGFIFGGTGVGTGQGADQPVTWNYGIFDQSITSGDGQHDIWDVIVRDNSGAIATHTLDFLLV